jgi:hypothetical protein
VWHWDTDRTEYVCHYCARDDTHAGDCPWALARANLPALLTEVAALRAELARWDAALAAAAHLGRCWAALCRCTDEFLPDYPDACAEHEQALYGAVEAVIAATGAAREEGS